MDDLSPCGERLVQEIVDRIRLLIAQEDLTVDEVSDLVEEQIQLEDTFSD